MKSLKALWSLKHSKEDLTEGTSLRTSAEGLEGEDERNGNGINEDFFRPRTKSLEIQNSSNDDMFLKKIVTRHSSAPKLESSPDQADADRIKEKKDKKERKEKERRQKQEEKDKEEKQKEKEKRRKEKQERRGREEKDKEKEKRRREKEERKAREQGKEQDRDREKPKEKDEKEKEKKKGREQLTSSKSNDNNEDYDKLESDKDFDPNTEYGKDAVYIESLSDLTEDDMKLLKRTKVPEEKFAENLDVLLRVLSFVKCKDNKVYRRKAWPEKVQREQSNNIFITPGKFLKYPDEVDAAREKFCPTNGVDPKTLIKFGEFEGQGGFGRVFAGRIRTPRNAAEKVLLAVKVMPHKTDKEIKMNFNELGFLKFCAHPNIVKYHRSFLYNDELWVIMEFLEGGTLREATGNFQFAEAHIAYVAREMLKGIEFLHNSNIAHRDLKSANVMLSMKAEVKLIDFGLATDFTETKEEVHLCGSPFWMPPEMITHKPHSLPADIWSFAVCLVEMMLRKVPNNNSRLKSMFLVGSEGLKFTKEEQPKWSSDFHDIISKCLQYDPKDRPKASELLQHPFLKKAAPLKEMQRCMPAIFLSNTMMKQGLL